MSLLDPNPMQNMMQSPSGAPNIMQAPMIPQQQMQQPSFGQRFRQNLGPILQGLGIGLASGNMGAGTAALPALADRRQRSMLEQQQMQQEQQRINLTKKYLESIGRQDLAPLVDAGQADQALRIATQKEATPEAPNSVQEYQYAVQNGFKGSYMDFNQAKGGGVNVNNYGSIPQGYEVFKTPEGSTQMRPIPGGPADTSQQDAAAQGNQAIASDVVMTAAQRAREAAKQRLGGAYGQGASVIPQTAAAEVQRQVNVLKSSAKIENLTAMRAASPTGGALGAVTPPELQMLADKSGALDPNSPTFERDLDDYERTLLRVIHGNEAGEQIYQQSRGVGAQGGENVTGSGVKWKMK